MTPEKQRELETWLDKASEDATREAEVYVLKHIGGEQTFATFAKGVTLLFVFVIANIFLNKKIDERFRVR